MKNKMNQPDHFNSLCMTCKNKSSCIFIENGNRPVQHCEEFEVYAYRIIIKGTPPLEQKVMVDKSHFRRKGKEDKPSLSGICKNCDNRKTCMNAKPERIIWHCEEYV